MKKKQTLYFCANSKVTEENISLFESLQEKVNLVSIDETSDKCSGDMLLLGGDGSLNYFVNNVNEPSRFDVLYIPLGTANDFSKSLKLNQEELDSNKVLSIIEHAKKIRIPIMLCNDRKFINVATAGTPAKVTDSGSDLLKKITGTISYYVKGVEELVSPEPLSISYKCSEGNETISTLGFVIAQGVYAGGGIRVSTNFTPSFKETFNFVTIGEQGLADNLATLIKMQSFDMSVFENPKLTSLNLENLEIRSDSVIPVKLDGEEYQSDALTFRKSECALSLFLY